MNKFIPTHGLHSHDKLLKTRISKYLNILGTAIVSNKVSLGLSQPTLDGEGKIQYKYALGYLFKVSYINASVGNSCLCLFHWQDYLINSDLLASGFMYLDAKCSLHLPTPS